MYLFKGIMKERISYDNLPSVVIALESDIKRIQRRKFFRVNLISIGHFLFKKRLSDQEIEQLRERMLRKYKNENEFIIDETITEKVALRANLKFLALGFFLKVKSQELRKKILNGMKWVLSF
jgi:hypothetical protein